MNQVTSAPVAISVVIPIFGCADCLFELSSRLTSSLSKVTDSFEVVLVNDGSVGSVHLVLSKIVTADSRFHALNLSRNFGQHPAIRAGLDYANGQWIVVIDCDLQDRPEEIP